MTEKERTRLESITAYDREYWGKQGCVLGGMDEVGRGPLAGPVAACCIIMPSDPLIEHVNDSKKLSESRREKIYPVLIDTAVDYCVSFVEPDVIDSINILEATRLAFTNAYNGMKRKPTDLLIDALQGLKLDAEQHILIHGDALSYSIAAASIVAKVHRDRYMIEMDRVYPEYKFAKNKGYGTAEHIEALRKFGPCPIHRISFISKFLRQ
ncbi:MAG: ribonuclease HII [Clostridia bacterium]|nr:ribonuclease HII [Clostridia bacterium]MCR5073142.1 ribonuclease HII [Clostridiales bacterium]